MIATGKTAGGVLVPLVLSEFEHKRRFLQWEKQQRKKEAWEAIHDIDARRGSYMVRNFGIDKIIEMDKASRERRRKAAEQEAERIADMMAMDAARSLGTSMCW